MKTPANPRRKTVEYQQDSKKRYACFSKRKFGIFKKSDTICKMTGCNVTILLQTESGNFFHYCSNKKSEQLVQAMIKEFSTDKASSYALKKGGASGEKVKKSPMDSFAEKHTSEVYGAAQVEPEQRCEPSKNPKKRKESPKSSSPAKNLPGMSAATRASLKKKSLQQQQQKQAAAPRSSASRYGQPSPSSSTHQQSYQSHFFPHSDHHNGLLGNVVHDFPQFHNQENSSQQNISADTYKQALFLNQQAIDVYRKSMSSPINGNIIPSVKDLMSEQNDSDKDESKRMSINFGLPYSYDPEESSNSSAGQRRITPPMLLPSEFSKLPSFGTNGGDSPDSPRNSSGQQQQQQLDLI